MESGANNRRGEKPMQGNMSPSAGDVEYANLAMKLNQNGLPGVATINSVTEPGEASDPVSLAAASRSRPIRATPAR